MQEHPTFQQLNLYQRRALGPDLFLSIHRHVSACPKCFEQCSAQPRVKEDYATLLAALLPAPDEEAYHLTKAQLAGYVRRNLDDLTIELADSHLEVCAECTQTVKELHAATATDSFATGTDDRGVKVRSFRHKTEAGLMAFFTAQRLPAQLASLVLLALGAILIVLLFVRARHRQPTQPLISHDAKADLNANKGNTLTTNQTDRAPTKDQSTTSDNGEKTLTQPRRERRSDSTSVVTGSNAGGAVAIGGKIPPSLRRAIMSAWTSQRLEPPGVLTELKGAPGRLLSDSGNGVPFQLLSPISKVVQSRRPTFIWRPLDGAGSYKVTVADEKLEEVASSGQLTETKWSAPVPLKRGHTYSWQVTAFKDGQVITSPVMPAPQAKFKVLHQKHNEELKRMKRSFPNYHLGLGVLYTRVGLLDEAEQEFQALLKENPGSVIAARLLQSLRSMKE